MKQELMTHYGRVRLAPVYANRNEGGTPQFKINTLYINNMRKVIRVQLRSGMEMTVPPVDPRSPRANDGEFIVQMELVIEMSNIEQMRTYFSTVGEEDTGPLQAFRDSFMRQYQEVRMHMKPIICTIDFPFTEQELQDVNGVFYHEALDSVFKLGEGNFPGPHPNSPAGRREADENKMQGFRDSLGFVFSIEIIDSLGRYGDRYISICNQIYKIHSKSDNNKPDGIYVISSKPANGRLTSDQLVTVSYPFEDAEKRLGLYPTYEQAASFGDQAAARKREIVELEHTIAMNKQQAAIDKMEHDRVMAERDRHLADLEYERGIHKREMEDLKERQEHLLEMERMRLRDEYERRKDDYDRKASERKDTSELLKFMPHILAAIGALLMAYKTYKV